ncbi:NAD(P)H-hydrate dehydratase [Flexibacterium corallicola]|uniref:NAD(P)H-hydrate dehydratase n=1 Tax=Flexibacterium corallicola TaxID=3037259 RepID=UPI00286EFCB0|nr:NAD(P)H-hydrate dehydratase [Pseudovibrio sp. M1P-2-3]
MSELLTPAQMGQADRLTIEGGVPGIDLMEKAGCAVAAACKCLSPQKARILIVAGPGNNGGDGFVAARYLVEAGYEVLVYVSVRPNQLKGDAATAFLTMDRPCISYEEMLSTLGTLTEDDVVVDALFGAGLTRDLEGQARSLVCAINQSSAHVVAVDLPSGLDGRTGCARGCSVEADVSVSFFRPKVGHYLHEGPSLCGALEIVDIGVKSSTLPSLGNLAQLNAIELWKDVTPSPERLGHKYSRGHLAVVSGDALHTGASRLSALAGQRIGAGLVSVVASADAAKVHANHLTSVMVMDSALEDVLSDPRYSAVVVGPAAGIGGETRSHVLTCLKSGRALVLDADALTSFEVTPEVLFSQIQKSGKNTVLTPHEGEFCRLFPDLAANKDLSKVDRAQQAALRSGAIIVLKGADTVIASPDNEVVINASGTPWLATAGSGDVLAGLCAGLLAQGVPAFEAACQAVWVHGRAAELCGPFLIAEDLISAVPQVYWEILE